MIVVNYYGGPGSGKSTTAAKTFAALKDKNINAELVTEFAKDKVWEGSLNVLHDQPYILGKQFHRLFRCVNDVDVVVTDSPLLNSIVYANGEWGRIFDYFVCDLIKNEHFSNLHYFIKRDKPYNPKGRVQTEEKARKLDTVIQFNLAHFVGREGYDWGFFNSVETVVADVESML